MGDDFFRAVFNTLIEMRNEAIVNNHDVPYLHSFYNVHSFSTHPSSGNHRTICRVINALIQALNTCERLPRFLVVIIDKDIIEDVGIFDFGATNEIAKNLEWLMCQMKMYINRKHTELMGKCPGAVYTSDPKVIFVRMIRRPLVFRHGSKMEN